MNPRLPGDKGQDDPATEVGRIRVTGYQSKGRINKRIRLAVEDL